MLYNKILTHIVLPVGSFLTKQSVLEKKAYWKEKIYLPKGELEDFQRESLNKLLESVVRNNEYYRSLNIRLTGDPYLDIKKFPVLTKALIHENKELIVKDNVDLDTLHLVQTSGSSGERGIAYVNREELASMRSIQLLWWELAGYKIGTKILQTGMAEKRTGLKRFKDFFLRTEYIKAFNCTDEYYYNILKKYKDRTDLFLAGYASSVYVISNVNRKYNLNIKAYSVIVWGDKLFDHYRKSIESSFGTKVHDTYAVSEGFMVGFQKDLPYMYQVSPQTYIEILDDNGEDVKDGEIGHVHLTKLDVFSFPLIRYKVKDLAIKLPKEQYPEKSDFQLPILQKIVGRETDIVVNGIGEKLVVHYFTGIFEYIEEIKQFKIVQENSSLLNVHYIPNGPVNQKLKDSIIYRINKSLVSPFEIIFTEVSDIPATKSGKPQIIEIIKK